MAGSVIYSLTFKNNSTRSGSAAVYQTSPNLPPGAMSLVWFSKFANPNTQIVFQWQIDYSFVWAQTGVLKPGVVFLAAQMWQADLSSSNQVTFSQQGGMFTFQNQGPGPQQGTLYILENNTISLNQAAVGIGMSGAGTFVVQALPNYKLSFTPQPQYWITFGDYIQGQVLDVTTIPSPARVDFPAGVYSMTATLNQDDSWTIQPSG